LVREDKKKSHKELEKELLPVYIWILSFLKPYVVTLVVVVMMMIIKSVAELVVPKMVGYFIDEIIPTKNTDIFLLLIVGLLVVFVIQMITLTIENISKVKLQENASRDLQYTIFSHLRKLGFSYFEKRPVGESLALLNTEVTAIQKLYREGFPYLIN
jgi:ATP-binding cassette, subfamily B, bacterial